VAANIAEGAKRKSDPDYARLLNIAEGSLAETEALLAPRERSAVRRFARRLDR
jgi:four helix bundle protein